MPDSPTEDLLHKHKLCGFFCSVLSVNSPQQKEKNDLFKTLETLAPGTPFSLFRDGPNLGFRSFDDFISLLPIQSSRNSQLGCEFSSPNLGKIRVQASNDGVNTSRKRRWGGKIRVQKNDDLGKIRVQGSEDGGNGLRNRRRGMGFVDRSINVIEKVHALTLRNCLKIVASLVRVSVSRDGNDARAVLLIDVYLPLALWSGWQFPKSGAIAASLFKHLSCDWEARKSLLFSGGNQDIYAHENDKFIWSPSDCHVLGCNLHPNISGSPKNRLFELHEIFKSLPAVCKVGKIYSTKMESVNSSCTSGIWDVSDDVLTNVLSALGPKDLVRIAATCRHLRSLAVSIMPCMKLTLFPHQQAAIEWMLRRENNAEVLSHPLYMDFSTEDGFHFYINAISGEISTGMAPTIRDFRGGMFCDEPGLGKTVTALSLILKTHGTLADPPQGVVVTWCTHNPDQRCGYYELSADCFTPDSFMSTWKRFIGQNGRRKQICPDKFSPESVGNSKSSSPKKARLMSSELCAGSAGSPDSKLYITSCTDTQSLSAARVLRCTKNLSRVKRNLLNNYESSSPLSNKKKVRKSVVGSRHISNSGPGESHAKQVNVSPKKTKNAGGVCSESSGGCSESNETWVQCDACSKWRKLSDRSILDATAAWFCSMNSDTLHQSCAIPEESWDFRHTITYMPGFYTKGTPQGEEQNVSFFESVLKEHCTLINSATKKALTWLANLSNEKLLEMETIGLRRPVVDTDINLGRDGQGYGKIFQAFGLIRRAERDTSRWYYPCALVNLEFDTTALRIALTKPLDLFRLYLSGATLIVVPSNLVDHWVTQILKHVRAGQLRIYVWTDQKKPLAHNLAWDYDIVITTFNRLSLEWGPRKRSILMQVHWLRVILDEGHTLGSSLNFTNKLQMAISLAASNRWLLTGTPTANTPNSQLAQLQPMLKFLHEEAYGHHQKSWEAGILRPFEAEMEEGRSRLLQLLQRCMISARKIDLKAIPPCIKKVTFLHFTEEHARSYNELVVTVRRNILMADWNDPSHVESLLNPKQWKFRSNTIRNVRLSCCVAGHIKVTDAGQDIQETMDILVEQGLDPVSEEYVFIKYALLNGGSCFRCKEWCRLPVITPCRHLLCLDCVALNSERCTFPGCGNSYEMQSPEILNLENPNPKWPVPKDLIELQPSYKQDDWDPDWQSTSSSKVAYLVERLKGLQEANRKIGYCIDESDDMKSCGEGRLSSQKSHWRLNSGIHDKFYKILPEKVIIFSQFLEHIHVIEQQLTGAGIEYVGMYSPMHSSNKMKSLTIFQHDPNCMALLMDGSAALGLDLSFVTHVFLMEPIWDRSMEEQVISRAHRMGATRPIHVETLAMHGTIEEQMVEFLQDANEFRRNLKQDFCRSDREGARAHRTLHDFAESNYLAQLGFVRTNAKV
ncbi:SNF2 domain-containing protein / helicase domain-containing protein / F-box family protein [Tasmannia lanceolata]|uniref:SNF2 domain-containing protein / helicase domain-containing protein / F-box family protein n=1 Tax=Tasmannia lanceolata TaxID=3420 RepID=UPI0040639098